ncbi:MAG TPA: hypothetical protein DDX39_01195 [Bacteroidales bacterium]|nr:MAG: hypothetical protein A2W98_07405 [Bacteroidetes bacterium GWF2_33_38]HBF87227.1 hypothetical protein [Bacteroidales bacterium]
MKAKNVIVAFVVMMISWLLLNWSFNPIILVVGVILSLAISVIFCGKCSVFEGIKITPKAFLYTFIYLFVFIRELIKANIDVTKRVLSPTLPINPGIVKIKTNLKSKMARLILANSITLTPGTFTVHIEGDFFYIHWISVEAKNIEEATQKIADTFENILKELYD